MALSVPTMSSPPTSHHISNSSSFNIAGGCADGNKVDLNGDDIQSKDCASSAYSFVVNKSSDGTYAFSISQKDAAGNASPPLNLTWVRDTSVPSIPTISIPISNPINTNSSTLTISGSCLTGQTVSLSGADSQSVTCAASSYSFAVNKAADGIYDFNLTQVNQAQTPSAAASLRWVRDTVSPASVTISVPTGAPSYISGDTSFTLSGECETFSVVALSGAQSGTTICSASGTYSFIIGPQGTDGTYGFSLKQTDGAGNDSTSKTFQWIRDTSIPPAPTLVSPSFNPFHSNGSSVTISGACTDGFTVYLSGAQTQNVVCSGQSYSFSITMTVDGSYGFSVTQVNAAGTSSAGTAFLWDRDTVSPAQPSITSPSSNPLNSGDTTLAISGGCESGGLVTLSGSASAAVSCVNSSYNFSVTKSVDATYNFAIFQTDLAGNTSSSASFQWTRDTTIPETPLILSPSIDPFYSNGTNFIISGSCVSGDTVLLEGSDTQSVPCAASSFQFTVIKSVDGNYPFSISEVDGAGNTSAQATVRWIRDTQIPSAPVITNPLTQPFFSSGNLTISGSCLDLHTVNLSGDASQSVLCNLSSFSFTVLQSVDSTYNFSITQTSLAGNTSPAVGFQWVRDSTVPPTPVIAVPALNPFVSNSSTLTIAGSCINGNTVLISGDVSAAEVTSPPGALSQTCNLSSFSFDISKTSDGVYSFQLVQVSLSGISSGTANVQWTRDTVVPVVTLTSSPPASNLTNSASFSFVASKPGSTFQCRLDAAAFAICINPTVFLPVANGIRVFEIFATDSLGNVGPVLQKSWSQEAFSTIALYHFDTSPGPTVDESGFTGSLHNNLTDNGTTIGASSKFGEARNFSAASLQNMQAPHNASQSLVRKTMSIEAWVKFNTLPTVTGTFVTIASKGGASGQFGWELRIRKNSTRHNISFSGSLNGTTKVVRNSSSVTLTTSSFHHIAVTWNQGSLIFFLDGVQRGTGTIGTAGTSELFDTPASLRLGRDQAGEYLDGIVDEFRLSQILRWTGTFTLPTNPYTQD